MKGIGVLEGMARIELDALVRDAAARYRPGALDTLSATDPAWRMALDRAEREVGDAFEGLRAAEVALVRWQHALAELARLWARVGEADPEAEAVEALPRVA